MADALRRFSGLALLAALGLAPLYFGSTRLLPLQALMVIAGTGGVAWMLSCVVGTAWNPPPAAVLIALALIAVSALAWLFFLSPPDLPPFTRTHLNRIVNRWPNSVVPRPFPLLLTWAAIAGIAFLALCDFARDPAWRRAIVIVMLSTGAAVALLGLIQNATRARSIYWLPSHRMPGAFFGTFFHHTAAGAYLNSVWPIGLALTLQLANRKFINRWTVAAALSATGLVLAAHAGHVSRFPQVIAMAALVAFLLWSRAWQVFVEVKGLRITLVAVGVLLAGGVMTLGATRVSEISARWNLLVWDKLVGVGERVTPPPESEWRKLMRPDLFVASDHSGYPLGDRGAAYSAAIEAVAQRPWFGWGPGGWTAAAAATSTDPFTRTFFLTIQFTHQDFLQALVEWGIVGGLGWTLLLAGAIVWVMLRVGLDANRNLIGTGAAVALFAILTQSLIDFPLQIPALQLNALALAALCWSTAAVRKPAAVLADSVPSTHECAQSH